MEWQPEQVSSVVEALEGLAAIAPHLVSVLLALYIAVCVLLVFAILGALRRN